MKVFGLVGKSGSGKTTLTEKLVQQISALGIRVSTMKHTHHKFDIDKPGKDSYRHREAGASEVMLASSTRWALLHENLGPEEPSVDELIAHMTPVDLLLIEGFKHHDHPKIELHDTTMDVALLYPDDPSIVALAGNCPPHYPEGCDRHPTYFDRNDIAAIVDFILQHCGLCAPKQSQN